MSDLIVRPEGYNANKTAINSALLGRVNSWSDSNVLLQQKVTGNEVAVDFRMFCNRCKDHKRFRYSDFLERGRYDRAMATLEQYCREHRHAEAVLPNHANHANHANDANYADSYTVTVDDGVGSGYNISSALSRQSGPNVVEISSNSSWNSRLSGLGGMSGGGEISVALGGDGEVSAFNFAYPARIGYYTWNSAGSYLVSSEHDAASVQPPPPVISETPAQVSITTIMDVLENPHKRKRRARSEG